MYQLIFTRAFSRVTGVLRLEDGMHIPQDLANTDYQTYLKWLEAGNTPLPALDGSSEAP